MNWGIWLSLCAVREENWNETNEMCVCFFGFVGFFAGNDCMNGTEHKKCGNKNSSRYWSEEQKMQRKSRINWVSSLSTHYLHSNNYTTLILYRFPIYGFSLHLAAAPTARDSFIKMQLNLYLIIRREKRPSEIYEREHWKKQWECFFFFKKKKK